MELETVNKLYLELSQFATATTANEFRLMGKIKRLEGGWIDRRKESPNCEDGEKIIAWGNGYAFECEYDGDSWTNIAGDDFTHWMPHPGAPE